MQAFYICRRLAHKPQPAQGCGGKSSLSSCCTTRATACKSQALAVHRSMCTLHFTRKKRRFLRMSAKIGILAACADAVHYMQALHVYNTVHQRCATSRKALLPFCLLHAGHDRLTVIPLCPKILALGKRAGKIHLGTTPVPAPRRKKHHLSNPWGLATWTLGNSLQGLAHEMLTPGLP